ncbi:hypothetical protein LLEC1_01854 [Akanthomyces lecanii]|uniref:Xylanolytic transcriptional activator regulatory domain-containing protein n=1 Tax=Cordyceps confragosa TaxID=2714763 RepID=A0A179I2D2_CORDF|nr:hypothetical protein LLEC1_01854 [Akanthomyces lecanii]
MHIDGETWFFSAKVLESRYRLWYKFYCLDRSISLAVGRPYKTPIDMTSEEAESATERALTGPTPTLPTLYFKY